MREKQSGIASHTNPYSDNDSEIRHITGFLSPQTSPRQNSEYAQSHSVRRQSEVNAFYKKIKKTSHLNLDQSMGGNSDELFHSPNLTNRFRQTSKRNSDFNPIYEDRPLSPSFPKINTNQRAD